MSARRQDFLARFDWIRRALMFEPRGHDMMSGSIVYPAINPGSHASILFMETSGCLPMCGHGTIGTVTFALEQGLIAQTPDRRLRLDVPAGIVEIEYEMDGPHVASVRLRNVASYLAARDIEIDCPGLGALTVDVAYGGNFYVIVEPQQNYRGIDALKPDGILRFSPLVRDAVRAKLKPVHPDDATVVGVSHVMWTDAPRSAGADARNAVFYGDRAIDRSPCGTGTSARMAQLAARGRLKPGDTFVHESIIGSLFDGRHDGETRVGPYPAIVPSVAGWARQTGFNTITVDDRDPYAHGFQVA